MAKSFKKVLASLLAVLMVVFSMPFSAFAMGGDYKVDVTFQFSPVYTTEYFDYDEVISTDNNFEYTMLQEAPLTYKYKMAEDYLSVSGKLVLEAQKTQNFYNSAEDLASCEPLTEDRELGVGDYFAITIVNHGVSAICAAQIWFQYSDNIEPAGLYEYKNGRKTYQGLCGMSDDNFENVTIGGLKAVDSMSGAGLVPGVDDGILGNLSSVTPEPEGSRLKNLIRNNVVCQNGTYSCSTKVDTDVVLTNPETGEAGYDYAENDIFPNNTFIFKIIDEGDITFNIYDHDNSRETAYGAYFYCDDGTDNSNENYNTYAHNYGTGNKQYPNDQPGSMKMTFYGTNVLSGEGINDKTCEHENWHYVNQKAASCGVAGYTGDKVCDDCGETFETGTEIPALTHSYTSKVTTDATCGKAGVTTWTCGNCGDSYTTNEPAALVHDYKEVAGTETDSTCTVAGKYADKKCEHCGDVITGAAKELAAHTPGTPTKENEVAATETSGGSYDMVTRCTECQTVLSTEHFTTDPITHQHAYSTAYTKPTCTTNGYTTYTCSGCGDTYVTYDEPDTTLGHNYEVVDGTAKAPSCGVAGKEADKECSNCHDVIPGAEIPALTHNYQEVDGTDHESTCTTQGKYADKKCEHCGDTIIGEAKPLADHIPGEATKENEVAATKSEDGSYDLVTRCTECEKVLSTEHKTIAATGVNVTIGDTYENYGTVTPDYGTKNYKYGDTVTVSATPVEGAEFVGWSVSNKIISTDLEYSFVAYVDTEITPVFCETSTTDTISVVFLDMYKNITVAYNDVSVDDFKAAMTTAIPVGTEYPGYSFKGWNMSDEDILALDHSATISAIYEIRDTEGYTINAAGAEISVSGVTTSDVATGVDYDALATVTADGAKAWKVGDTIVEYGDTYSFFVGSDITVTPIFDDVEDIVPTVAIISSALSGSSDYKVAFLATSAIPESYTLIDRGFVYGKAATKAELTLDNVGATIAASGAKVKAVSAGSDTTSYQFGLTYGIKAKDANAVAVAYVTVKDASGKIVTVYSDASVFVY